MNARGKITIKFLNDKWKIVKKCNPLLEYAITEYPDEWARSECAALFQLLLCSIAEHVETQEDVEANLNALVKKSAWLIPNIMKQKDGEGRYSFEQM